MEKHVWWGSRGPKTNIEFLPAARQPRAVYLFSVPSSQLPMVSVEAPLKLFGCIGLAICWHGFRIEPDLFANYGNRESIVKPKGYVLKFR